MERFCLGGQIYDLFLENAGKNDKFNLKPTVFVLFQVKIARLKDKPALIFFFPINLGQSYSFTNRAHWGA